MILLLWKETTGITIVIDSTLPYPVSVLVIRNSPLEWPVDPGDEWAVTDGEEWPVPAEPVMAWAGSSGSSWGVSKGTEWELRR